MDSPDLRCSSVSRVDSVAEFRDFVRRTGGVSGIAPSVDDGEDIVAVSAVGGPALKR